MSDKKSHITYHILFSGLLVAVTSVFVWSFQPIMKLFLIPIYVYGVVYFINHLSRALSSLFLGKIIKVFSIKALAVFSFVLFATCFLLIFLLLNIQPLPVYINFLYFVFVSATIGTGLSFCLSSITRIHTLIPLDMRATISSINTATGRLFGAFFFVLLKILMDGDSIKNSLMVCFLIFLTGIYPLRKICKYK